MDRRRRKEHARKLILLFTIILAFIPTLTLLTTMILQKALYTFSRNKSRSDNGGGSGWSDEGMVKYRELYKAVKRDRRKQPTLFNQELLKMYQKRRQLESGHRRRTPQRKGQSKKRPFKCINQFNDSSGDEDTDEEDHQQDKENNCQQESQSHSKNKSRVTYKTTEASSTFDPSIVKNETAV